MALNELTDAELTQKASTAKRALTQARFRHKMGQLENTASLAVLRREVAQLETEARKRELAQGLTKGSLLAKPAPAAPAEGEAPKPAKKGGFLKGIVDKVSGAS